MTDNVKITTRWHNADVLQCLYGETVVAETFWNSCEWIFFAIDPEDGEVDHAYGQVWIEVDPEREEHMRQVREENAKMDDGPRQVANATLQAMRRAFRDDEDNRDLVRVRSIRLAQERVRNANLEVK